MLLDNNQSNGRHFNTSASFFRMPSFVHVNDKRRQFISGVRVARSLVFCAMFCRSFFLPFVLFLFGNYFVCPSIFYFWLHLWHLQNLLIISYLWIFTRQYFPNTYPLSPTLSAKTSLRWSEDHINKPVWCLLAGNDVLFLQLPLVGLADMIINHR